MNRKLGRWKWDFRDVLSPGDSTISYYDTTTTTTTTTASYPFSYEHSSYQEGVVSFPCHCHPINKEGHKRDVNFLFKFKVGDRVIKRWKWLKSRETRFHIAWTRQEGTISEIYPHGEICVKFGIRPTKCLHFGASELDLITDPNSKEEPDV